VIAVAAILFHGEKAVNRHGPGKVKECGRFLRLEECVLIVFAQLRQLTGTRIRLLQGTVERRQPLARVIEQVGHIGGKSVVEEIDDARFGGPRGIGCRDDTSGNCHQIQCFPLIQYFEY
jgi:hypothetical protein